MNTLNQLDTPREITLTSGTIRYYDIGDGPALFFVHGVLVNSALWRKVIPELATRFRCIAPDLPLGGHSIPMPAGADQSPPGVARLVAEMIASLELEDVTLVGNDTGGAICQLVIAHHRERISRLVLTNCDAFEQFPPALLVPFIHGPRIFGESFMHTLAWVLRSRRAQRLLIATLSRMRYTDAELDQYFAPLIAQAAIRRDASRFLAAASNKHTLEAAHTFASFKHRVTLVWGTDDPFFTRNLAQRLSRAFPNASLTFVPQSRAFLSEDQPQELVRRIMAEVPVHVYSRGQGSGAGNQEHISITTP
jgi:pimeloyl-ACP methyl ester carboxylesterase